MSLIKNSYNEKIDKIFITASGGPFLNLPINKFKGVSPNSAVKHPRWSMGKKISVDSATMMNKLFEVIEAKKIFNLKYSQLKILIHPKSYVHAIIKFKNGLTKMLIHDTDMSVPIFNSIYNNTNDYYGSKKLDFKLINNLDLSYVNKIKFPSIDLLKKIPNNSSLLETVLVSSNDVLVECFLNKMIKFTDINNNLKKILNLSEFRQLKKVYPKNLKQIMDIDKKVRLKTLSICIK